jgi:hypothetical protein
MFDWKMISSDSHVVEPPNLWTERMDRAFRDRGPRVVSEFDGDWWMIDGTRGNSFQGGAQVGKRFEHADEPAARFSEVRRLRIRAERAGLPRVICRLTAALRAPSIALTAGRARSVRPEANERRACGSSRAAVVRGWGYDGLGVPL